MKQVFHMRNTALAAATIGCMASGSVYAQSNVSVYGVLDTGVEYLNRVEGSGSMTRMPLNTGGQTASRLGFRGSEDLGGGLKAVFVLESGLSLTDGRYMQGGRAFGRQAFVGLSGSWGSLTFGRQQAMGQAALMASDVIGSAVYSLASLNSYIPNQRMDNSAVYQGSFGNWTVAAMYSTARDGLPPSNCGPQQSKSGCSGYSGMLQYDNKRWAVTLAHNANKGIEGSGFFGQPPGLVYDNKSHDNYTFLTGYLMLNTTRFGGGVIHRELRSVNETFRSDQYFLGVRQPLSASIVLDAEYIYLNANREQANAQLLTVRGSYNLSRRSAAYISAGYLKNDAQVGYSVSAGTPVPASPGLGRSQAGMMVGFRHSF
ncbi:porin [Lampropedia aestuarii]|uniref:porin n=1 Tax=Lampropedia aestuarii TaxID=2562762 RepID=UPI002468D330|nr:porin [Lampropedia aestuarii]MDH5857189.1 porin [Lampropedia aestuarii]